MILTLKKIIKLINNDDSVKINYYNKDKEKHNYLMFIDILSKELRWKYDNMSEDEKKEYVSDSAVIYIPLISVYVLAEEYRKNSDYSYEYTLEKVKKIVEVDREQEEIVVALYMILHELGHWNYLKKCDYKPYLYIGDTTEEERVFNIRKKLETELLGKATITESDKERIKKHTIMYNNLKNEKIANEYADKYFEEKYMLLRNKGYV